jgi:hypothetical protein
VKRLITAVAVTVAACLAATSCDTSPYAATVNGQAIKQTSLNAELASWASNPAYVTAFDQAGYTTGAGITVTVSGEGSGTYNMSWVGLILDGMISATAVHQYLEQNGLTVSATALEAARAVREISQIGWYQFSPSFRDVLVQRLAEEATIATPAVPISTLKQAYRQYQQYFFTGICVVVEPAATQALAEVAAGSGVAAGTSQCFDQASLEQQPAVLRSALLGLHPGQVTKPIQTAFGWEVARCQSRADLPFGNDVERVLSVAIEEAEGNPVAQVQAVVAKAKVRVNPAYGSWDSSNDEVIPPSAPAISG